MPQSTPICPACAAPIVAYKPQDDLRSYLFCECGCTRTRLYLLKAGTDTSNVERLEQIWGPHAGILLEQARWVPHPQPCHRCNREDLEQTIAMHKEHPFPDPGPHTCGLDSRHQPASSG